MATAKRANRTTLFNQLARVPWLTILVLLFAAGAIFWWFQGTAIAGNADAGTGYGAKTACSCRFVAGRDLDDCRNDFVPGMEIVMLSEDEDAQSVTARVPLIRSQTAVFREGFGCVLESEAE